MSEALLAKVVVITGAAGGFGRAMADAFSEQGARLALMDVDAGGVEALAETLRGRGVECLPLSGDIRDPAACTAAMDEVIAAWGGVDVLVNNAGLSHRSLFSETAPEVLRRVIEVNLFGSMHCTAAALPSLRRRHGTVVAISSVAGFAPLIGRTGYAASKHALHGFFDTLREEVAADGVNVLLVCPTFADTAIRHQALGADGKPVGKAPASIGRPLTPEQVAEAVLDGVLRKRRLVVVGRVGRVAWWLSRLAPRVYARAMRRSQAAEFAP